MQERNLSTKPTFERNADATLEEVRSTYAERGEQYADSWHPDNMVVTFTRETLARFGITLDLEQIRLLQAAALIDIKDSRIGGGWKKDSVVDSIAYRACYTNLRDEYEQAHPPNPLQKNVK